MNGWIFQSTDASGRAGEKEGFTLEKAMKEQTINYVLEIH